jgi:DNA-binding transcriptional ArsR family regulator
MLGKAEVEYANLSKVFNALGSPVRLRILQLVCETKRPLHIKAVAEILRMDYGAVYRHIDVLKKAGLVQIFEVGRSRVLSPLHSELLSQLLTAAEQIMAE